MGLGCVLSRRSVIVELGNPLRRACCNVDRQVSYVYEKKMCPLIGVSHAEEILPIVRPRQSKMGKLVNYSHLSQVAITILLVVGAMFAMWARTR